MLLKSSRNIYINNIDKDFTNVNINFNLKTPIFIIKCETVYIHINNDNTKLYNEVDV